MTNVQAWTTFFGWLTIVNMAVYIFSVLMLWLMRDFAYRLNARLFGISEEQVAKSSFNYIAAYKLLIIVFCFAPWLALKLMV